MASPSTGRRFFWARWIWLQERMWYTWDEYCHLNFKIYNRQKIAYTFALSAAASASSLDSLASSDATFSFAVSNCSSCICCSPSSNARSISSCTVHNWQPYTRMYTQLPGDTQYAHDWRSAISLDSSHNDNYIPTLTVWCCSSRESVVQMTALTWATQVLFLPRAVQVIGGARKSIQPKVLMGPSVRCNFLTLQVSHILQVCMSEHWNWEVYVFKTRPYLGTWQHNCTVYTNGDWKIILHTYLHVALCREWLQQWTCGQEVVDLSYSHSTFL